MRDKIDQTSQFLSQKGIKEPHVGIILGTGLGKLIDSIQIEQEIEYAEIPNFPVSTVEFHKGKLIYGRLNGTTVLAMQGRFHYYEGYTLQEISFPIRIMKNLGIAFLLISNAGGALNPEFRKGSLMLLDDHINLLGGSPLIGKNHDDLGPRFPDMSAPYNAELNQTMERIAKENNIPLHKGVYAAVPGPNLETRAEYRYLRGIGADVVGMSTVPEVIVANHAGIPCAAISVLTDECDPDNLQPIDIKDILETAAIAEKDMIIIFEELIKTL
ncbi:MAG: purine-nucleoside phosphorylase [Bacteroidetes bacterium]|nr:purine-nucleoside phosphorylase [Bacteroidota bacterium]